MERKNIFLGYHLHIAVDIPALGGDPVTPLARAIDVVPAGHSSTAAGLRLVDTLHTHESPICHVIADRGYTYGTADAWALPLIERGIAQTLDLHATQHVTRPGPIRGTVIVDGGLYTDALPNRLRGLTRPSLGATAADKASSAEDFDRRLPYQFAPYGPAHPDGRRRYRGPALTGRMRCPNVPTSMRAGHTVPLSTCEPGESCPCGKTVTLDAEHCRERQEHPYGTTKWLADYGRRSAIESYNAALKVHHGSLRRGCIRVMGLAKNALFLALLIAACNLSVVAAHHLDPEDVPTEDVPPWTRPTKRAALHRRLWPSRGSPTRSA